MHEQALSGGRFADPAGDGDTVTRRAGPGAANIHALLDHLAAGGFTLAPRVLGTPGGGQERLSFLPGTAGHPPLAAAIRSDKAVRSAARAVRQLHDAAEGFTPPAPGRWDRQEVTVPAEIDCIGHGDLARWNLIFDGDQVTDVIDSDFAGPSNRAWDLSYLAHQLVPFHPTGVLAGFGWDTEPDRARRLRILATAYDPGLRPELLADDAPIRLLGMAAHIETQILAGNPAFAVHRDHHFAAGYRAATAFILTHRDRLLG
ncbi:phosphotransferase [Actinoplanes sp. NPDC026619]|uniref:phosphotransferase n=1 Tax=Actinoplanes sp. NPDC026619 TaxID=3155798 RepID=UPI0033F4F558